MNEEEAWQTWIRTAGDSLGVPTENFDLDELLDLTRDVAYGVERPAAPLSLFVVGYALAAGKNGDLGEVLQKIAALIPPAAKE